MDDNTDYYDSISEGYNELHGEEQKKKLEIIKAKLTVHRHDKMLDVGCGTGIALHFFDCFRVGIDPAYDLLKQSIHHPVQGFAEALPFRDKAFDIVISVTAVHNFADIEKGLEEIKRVGNNRFVITVLKKSSKAGEIDWFIRQMFSVKEIVDEEKDLIYLI